MMTPCMISGLSIPIENLRFSLPICLFPINILVYRLDFKSATRLWDYYESEVLVGMQYSDSNSSIKLCGGSEKSSTIPVLGIFFSEVFKFIFGIICIFSKYLNMKICI